MSNIDTTKPITNANQGNVVTQVIPAPAVAAPSATAKPSIEELAAQVFKLSAQVKAQEEAKLQAAIEAAKAQSASKGSGPTADTIDWTKISEKDIFDLSIPIPVVEQEIPEYLHVHLKDQNNIPRWIHTLRERLGPCLSSGYSYVKAEDIDERFPHPLGFDANGNYSYGDVVCLKISKARYFGAIKKNYLKTMAIHGRAKSREKLMETVQDDEHLGEAFKDQSIGVYTPEDMKGRSFNKDMFSAV
jgi:hypothetical protein